MPRLRSAPLLLSLLVAAQLAAAPAGAVCTGGATLLLVPEDCVSVKAAVAAIASGGTIDIAPGTAPLGGAPLNLSSLGKALTIRARGGPGSTTFSGAGSSQVVRIENSSAGSGKPIVFEGIRFADGWSASPNRSGGVTLVEATATFVDCRFDDNDHVESTTGGGALTLLDGSTALVVRTIFSGNSARNNGGAVYAVRNPGFDPVALWVHDSDFLDNSTAVSGFTGTSAGGAIYVRDADLVVSDSDFQRNLSGWVGGAIYGIGNWASGESCNFSDPTADLLVVRSRFLENRSDDAANAAAVPQTFGGGLHVERCTRARVHASLFEENEADSGGAIYLDRSRVEVEQTSFLHNLATRSDIGSGTSFGGAIAAITETSGTPPVAEMTIDRSLFVGGTAANPDAATANFGGCLFQIGNNGRKQPTTIRDTVFRDCHVETKPADGTLSVGGAIDAQKSDLTVEDSLFLSSSATATSTVGGAVAVRNTSVSSFTNVVMAGNDAANDDDFHVQSSNSSASPLPEQWSESPPATAGMLVAAPSRPGGAGGPFVGEAALGWAWRGSSATLDGAGLPGSPKEGGAAAAAGGHTLAVSGLGGCGRCAATILPAVDPATTLGASPLEIAGGGASTLGWTTPAGTFLTAFVDRGIGPTGASGGASTGALAASATYRRVAVTREGGAYAEVRVFVDEPAAEGLFSDGFESGDLAAWSASTGG